jgi:putative transposase
LFEKPADYAAFEKILAEAHAQTRIRIAAYCLMPNHWHLLLWPRRDSELSEILRWITVTHTQRWHVQHDTAGTGSVYQGRFKSFPVQTDEHFLTVARYVERNALRAKLVKQAKTGDGLTVLGSSLVIIYFRDEDGVASCIRIFCVVW